MTGVQTCALPIYGIDPIIIRAGKSNLFLSDVFTESFVNTTNVQVEFYKGDGSFGAARGGGIGAGIYSSADPFSKRKSVSLVEPQNKNKYDDLYNKWKELLNERLQNI